MDLQPVNYKKLVWLVVIVAFLIRISFLAYSPLRGWDETVYLNLGAKLSDAPKHYSLEGSGWNDYIPTDEPVYSSPNIGFRAPLLPYTFAVLHKLGLGSLIDFVTPFFAALSVYLIYALGRRLWNARVGFYAATFFALVPMHVYYGGRTLTDTFVVFFVLLTMLSFWRGYEDGERKHKVLFGLFLALSLLARYTTLWIAPIFLIYFLLRDKSLKFLKDKYLWYSVALFFVALIPWFVYGQAFYGNILGGFIHGFKAASYWGGVQPWHYFLGLSWQMLSALSFALVASLGYIYTKREYVKKEVYLVLVWLIFFLAMALNMPHKEDRFIMPLVPAVCLLVAYAVSQMHRYRKQAFALICIGMLFSVGSLIKTRVEIADGVDNVCFSRAMSYLDEKASEDAVIMTNQSPIVFYYTERQNVLYPEPWSYAEFRNTFSEYPGREAYALFANYDLPTESPIKAGLHNNVEKVFECREGWGLSAVYKYR